MAQAMLDGWTPSGHQHTREEVYRRIAAHPGVNNTDISVMLGWTINRVTPRVRELLDEGRIEVCGYKKSRYGVTTKCYRAVPGADQ